MSASQAECRGFESLLPLSIIIMKQITSEEREQKEIDYWKSSETENPDKFTIDNLINKMTEAEIFRLKLRKYQDLFESSNTILELGAGQGWASCILKSIFPAKTIYSSDISEHAIISIKYWEDIFKVKIDKTFSCRSYEIPLKDDSVDLIYCFQSAHHFTKIKDTVREIRRVLKKRGVCLFLNEPSCRNYLYKFAHKRANKNRPGVPEDVLIYKDIETTAEKEGFTTDVCFEPILLRRRPLELAYYYILSKIRPLQHILPCSADYILKK